jgi:hypothetical protein
MEPILMPAPELDTSAEEELRVRAWSTEQLTRLGLPYVLAYTFAGLVDWHAFADLVEHGCPPELALEIIR